MHMFKSKVFGLISTFAATMAQGEPAEIYGRWVPAGDQCSYDGSPSDSAFTIERDRVKFFESGCDFDGTPQSTGVGTAQSVRLQCSGEGDEWRTSVIYAGTNDDTLMVYFADGYAFIAERCPLETDGAVYPTTDAFVKDLSDSDWTYGWRGRTYPIRFGGRSRSMEVLPSWEGVNWQVVNENTVDLVAPSGAVMTLIFDSKTSFTTTDWDGSPGTGTRQ